MKQKVFVCLNMFFHFESYSMFQVLEKFEAITGKPLERLVQTWDKIKDSIIEEAESKFGKTASSTSARELIASAKQAKEDFRQHHNL